MLDVWTKANEDVLDFDVDWSAWLTPDDALDECTVTIEESTVENTTLEASVDTAPDRVKVWLSGGAGGESAIVKLVVKTTGGRTKERSYRLRVKER